MPRSLWNGSLSFGLVNVPVALYSAVRDLDVHFHQLHEKDGARIETRRFCKKEGRQVEFEEVGHAYDLDGTQVVFSDDELAAIAPRRTRTIEIGSFVDLADVDPILFDHPYWLVPTGESEGPLRAYRLLVEVMQSTDRVALGRFVLRSKEHLVAVRVRDGALALTTMRFADEIRPTTGMSTGGRKPKKEHVDGALAIIDALTIDWDPDAYEDRYRKRLKALVRKKEKGGTIEAPKQERAPAPAGDLMEALRKTLQEIRGEGEGDNGKAKTKAKPKTKTKAGSGSKPKSKPKSKSNGR